MRAHKPTTTTTPTTFIMKYSWTVYIRCIYTTHIYNAHRKLRHFDHFHHSSLSIHSMSDANTQRPYITHGGVRSCSSQSPISFGYLSQALHNASESPNGARTLTCITMKTSITDSTMTEHSLISLSLRSHCLV